MDADIPRQFKLSAEEASVAYFSPFVNKYADKLLLSWRECIPDDFLLTSLALSMAYRDCEKLQQIDKKINARDPTLGKNDAGKHRKYYVQARIDYKNAFEQLGYLMRTRVELRFPNGIKLEDVEEEYFQRIAIAARELRYCLRGDTIVSLKPFEYAIDQLLSRHDAGDILQSKRRLFEGIVADVKGLYSEIWPDKSSKKPTL